MCKPTAEYRKEIDVCYLRYSKNKVHDSFRSPDGFLVYDFDENNDIVGIEVLSVTGLLENCCEDLEEKRDKILPVKPHDIPLYVVWKLLRFSKPEINLKNKHTENVNKSIGGGSSRPRHPIHPMKK